MPYDGQLVLVLFPDGLLALQEELTSGFHPTLIKLLESINADDWEIKLARIAVHCDVLLDGTYTEKDIDKLGRILAGRLEVLREKVNEHVEIIRDPNTPLH